MDIDIFRIPTLRHVNLERSRKRLDVVAHAGDPST